MLIEQAFKQFTEQTLRETKNKKDYDVCIDTYIKTQLVDLSGLDTVSTLTERYSSYTPQMMKSKEIKDHETLILLPKDLEVNLPFDSCFIKLADNNDQPDASIREIFVFTREFMPMFYTGTIITYFKWATLKIPFTILYNVYEMQPVLSLDLKAVEKAKDKTKIINHLLSVVLRTFVTLSLVNQKSHNIYKVASSKPEYLRKKVTKHTTKVERPVYIYLDKNTTITRTEKLYIGRKIERLSSWIVRGHWRRLDNPKKRGKDSNGHYVVEGFTWVVPHICGNPDNLTNKTYIALQGKKEVAYEN